MTNCQEILGQSKNSLPWTPHPVFLSLGNTATERTAVYRTLFRDEIEPGMLDTIRKASNQGMALGNDRFKQEVESLTGRRVVSLDRGPKPKRGIA